MVSFYGVGATRKKVYTIYGFANCVIFALLPTDFERVCTSEHKRGIGSFYVYGGYSMKIYLSPSTQEHNYGVGVYDHEEKRMNELADIIEPLLKHNGFEVIRNAPSMYLGQVVDHSNMHNVDLHVALHTNAGGGEGCEVYYYPSSKIGKKLASHVYDEIVKLTPSTDRGVKPTTSLFETFLFNLRT